VSGAVLDQGRDGGPVPAVALRRRRAAAAPRRHRLPRRPRGTWSTRTTFDQRTETGGGNFVLEDGGENLHLDWGRYPEQARRERDHGHAGEGESLREMQDYADGVCRQCHAGDPRGPARDLYTRPSLSASSALREQPFRLNQSTEAHYQWTICPTGGACQRVRCKMSRTWVAAHFSPRGSANAASVEHIRDGSQR
jgi:hypothetical protein